MNAARRALGMKTLTMPETSMTGALSRYISCPEVEKFQPMGANLGVLPPLENRPRDKKERAAAYAYRGLEDIEKFLSLSGENFKPANIQK